jgi:hypothetical protein
MSKTSNRFFRLELLVAGTVLALANAGAANADDNNPAGGGDASPYLVGHWKLNDSFQDSKAGSPIVTENTEFVFLNPTKLTLTLDYAFFANPPEADLNASHKNTGATFCGCDEDTLIPNGRVRYTMLGEEEGGFLSRKLCPKQTDGVMKTIVFTSKKDHPDQINIEDALQAGYQIQTFNQGQGRTESDLKAVPVTDKIKEEIQFIHDQCKKFLKK